jgi:hypothetical protein
MDVSADETVQHMLVMDGMTGHKDNEEEEEEEVSEDFEPIENMTDHEDDGEEEESKDFEQVGNQELEDTEGLNHKETEENKSNEYVLVNTVRGNFKGYTRHKIKKAQEARGLQGMIGNPTKQEFAEMVHEKLITNCPITVQDVYNANQFFGRDLVNLSGKATRTKPEHVRVDYV